MTTSTAVERARWRRAVDEVWLVAPAWLTARALLVAGFVVAVAASDRLIDARPNQVDEGLLAWDGTWYRDIAEHGYGSEEALRFFPLFPLLGRALGFVLGGSSSLALILVANVASVVVLVLVRRLMLAEGHSTAATDRAVWLMALFPPAFVLAWGYSESLMLIACIGMFLALRRHQWWWAVLAGLAAGLSRPLGVMLVLPAVVEVIRAWRTTKAPERAAGVAAVLSPVVGTGIYLAWVRAAYGDGLLPFTVQDDFRGTGTNPFTRIWHGVEDLVGPERFGDGLHLPFAVGFVVLLVLTFRWWPVSYGLFAAGVMAASLSADNLNSLERYGLNAFPLVLTLALLARDERLERPILTIAAGGFVSLAALAWVGAYVP